MLHPTLAGHLPLQDMIQQTITSAREKLAAAEEKKESKEHEAKEHEAKEKKMPFGEKKKKEEAKEKNSSAILDCTDVSEMDKLASALEEMADDLIKEADSIENGGESKQGGEQLATMSPVGGKQNYKRDAAKHQVPNSTGLQAAKDDKGASTAVPTDDTRAPGGTGAKYPAKGVLKTAGENPFAAMASKKDEKKEEKGEKKEDKKDEEKEKKSSAVERLQAALEKQAGASYGKAEKDEQVRTARGAGRRGAVGGAVAGASLGHTLGNHGKLIAKGLHHEGLGSKGVYKGLAKIQNKVGGKAGAALGLAGGAALGYGALRAKSRVTNRVDRAIGQIGEKTKKSAADFILDKIAEFHGGGETLDSKSGSGPKPPSNPGRQLIDNNAAVTNAKKVDAKSPRKAELAQVLTEPAFSKAHDSKVQDNLRNAAKGGVKIAEATKEALQKIAADPSDPRHEALKKAIADRKAEKGEKEGEKKESEKEEKES